MKTLIKLRLFVNTGNQSARLALENLRAVCEDPRVARNYDFELEVVDINESPQEAENDRVLVTPTLLKKLPHPVRRVVGDLSNEQDIFVALDIQNPSATESKTGDGHT